MEAIRILILDAKSKGAQILDVNNKIWSTRVSDWNNLSKDGAIIAEGDKIVDLNFSMLCQHRVPRVGRVAQSTQKEDEAPPPSKIGIGSIVPGRALPGIGQGPSLSGKGARMLFPQAGGEGRVRAKAPPLAGRKE
jgi:hypothetical protein